MQTPQKGDALSPRRSDCIFKTRTDEENTADGWQCLIRYQYDVNEDGQFGQNPRHDEYSHGADAFQTFALSLKPEMAVVPKPKIAHNVHSLNRHQNGWMSG